jgi:hypothetical protein
MTITLAERNAALDRAKALILQGWTQGAVARNDSEQEVGYDDPAAICFCAYGAIGKVSMDAGISYESLSSVLKCALGKQQPKDEDRFYVSIWQDRAGRTKYEVAALFDHAKEQPL